MAGVSDRTVRAFEAGQRTIIASLDAIEQALEAAGVIFIGENGRGGAGVRLAKRKHRANDRARGKRLGRSNRLR